MTKEIKKAMIRFPPGSRVICNGMSLGHSPLNGTVRTYLSQANPIIGIEFDIHMNGHNLYPKDSDTFPEDYKGCEFGKGWYASESMLTLIPKCGRECEATPGDTICNTCPYQKE